MSDTARELRERVARAMSERESRRFDNIGYDKIELLLMYADAAIDLVLEEAARVVMEEREKDFPDFRSCARAIRALKSSMPDDDG